MFHEVREDLGIGVGGERVSPQFLAQLLVFLDDAVVDDGDAPVAGEMGMGVGPVDPAVGGPAGVAETDGPLQRPPREAGGKGGDLPGGLLDLEPLPVHQDDAGGVVAAVLKPPEAVEKDPERLPLSRVTDNSAHEEPGILSSAGDAGK